MKYKKSSIGERIKENRLAVGFKTQGEFAKRMGLSEYSRQTIAGWESGKTMPSLDEFFKMCDIFDCELGYLLCEYNCKKRTTTDIKEKTGLSENAISTFTKIKANNLEEILDTLSHMLEHKEFIDFLCSIHLHVLDFNNNKFRLPIEEIEILSSALNCHNKDIQKYLEASSKALLQSQFMKIIETLQ